MASLLLRTPRLAPLASPLCRTYATGPERRPFRRPDPLLNNPNATVAEFPDEGLTFIHRPPPSHATELSYASDPASPLLRPPTHAPLDTPLPPALKDVVRPKARLTDEQIQEMRTMRRSDPAEYTQKKLAEMYDTSPSTVGLVATLSQTQRTRARGKFFAAHEGRREQWGEKKATIVAMRQRRREFW
jgi:hypothetical protein